MLKNLLYPAFFLFAAAILPAQNCDPTFYYYNNGDKDESFHLALAPGGGFLIAGTTSALGAGGKDIYVLRIDALGNEIWNQTLGGTGNDMGRAVVVTADGNIAVAGTTTSGGYKKVYLAKINPGGTLLWETAYNDPNLNFQAEDLLEDAQENLLVAGSAQGNSGLSSLLMLKFDGTAGALLKKQLLNPYIFAWDENWLQPGYGNSRMLAIALANDGSYLFSGTSKPDYTIFPLSSNLIAVKTDPNLNIIWQKDFFGAHNWCYAGNAGVSILQLPDDFIYIADRVDGYCLDGPSPEAVIYKLDNQGNKIWDKGIGVASNGAQDMIATADGHLAIASQYAQLAKVDTAGNLLWSSSYGYIVNLDGKNCLQQTPDGGFALSGGGFQISSTQIVLLRTDSLGNNCKNQLSGMVYFDQNGNCQPDAGEPALPNSMVRLNPGPEYDLSGADGRYRFITDTGAFTISVLPYSSFWQVTCPPAGMQTLHLSTAYQKPDTLHFGLTPQEACPVVALESSLSSARICRDGQYRLELCNYGAATAGTIEITVQWPDQLKFLGANLPYTQSGNTYTFSAGPLAIGACQTLVVSDSVNCDATLSDEVCIDAGIQVTPSCNAYTYATTNILCRILTNSYDPNDKQGFPGNRYDCFVAGDDQEEFVHYLIRFQNTGNDTAYRVMVVDTLDTTLLDIESIRPGPASHPYELNIRNGNTLVWVFSGINLPDSLTNTTGSQGFLSFDIHTRGPLKAGHEIRNGASIYFDANTPVRTAENVLITCVQSGVQMKDSGSMDWRIYPNPATGAIRIAATGSLQQIEATIVDVRGRVVLENRSVQLPGGEIGLAGIPPGIYVVWLNSGGRRIARKLVIR